MGVLSDLVPKAQPALFGDGVSAAGTEGATWLWSFTDVEDDDGVPINLSSVTGVCKVVDKDSGTTVATLTFAGASGSFTIGLDEATTAGLAGGNKRVVKAWSLTLGDGTDVVQVWGPTNSSFAIQPGA